MENNYAMLLILLLPILGGIVSFFAGKTSKTKRNDIIDIIMGCELLTLGYLCYSIYVQGATIQLSINNILGFGLHLALDGMRLFFCLMVTAIFGVISQFMKESMKRKHNSNRFYLFFMATYTMVLGAFMTTNLFCFIMFMVSAMFFIYPMILHREDKMAMKNASVYLSFTITGLLFLMAGLVLIFILTGKLSYTGVYSYLVVIGDNGVATFGGLLMLIGFAIFAGMFPLQFQITKGSSYGLMEASAIITAVVSKLGLIGMMLLSGCVFMGDALVGKIFLGIALLTIVWGLFITLSVTDIRKILMGLNVVTNGFAGLGVSLMILCGKSNGYAVRGSFYMLIVSSLSLLILYMVAMEQVCKVDTYEINGLIESGKSDKMLTVICLLAGLNLGGVPGTIGYLAHSMIFKTLLTIVNWKWLTALYIILWAFLMTAVTRVFMKLFVSKKEKAMKILTTEDETEETALPEETPDKKNPYMAGEIVLLAVGIVQILIGILPNVTMDKMGEYVRSFFKGENLIDVLPYYTGDVMISFLIAAVLSVLLYINLVRGILLRAIKNKKNKKLKEKISE